MSESSVSKTNPSGWLRALGKNDLPASFILNGETFKHLRTFKHDFFAGTGLYEGNSDRVVLKIGRQAGAFGIPLSFIGKFLARREMRLLNATAGLEGIPKCLGAIMRTGLVRRFVDGAPVSKDSKLDDNFFPRLSKLLDEIHARDMAYVDLEKRENILLGEDGRPYLIDFQISWKIDGWMGRTWPAKWMLGVLQLGPIPPDEALASASPRSAR
ncbi:MAG: hypothetical protein IPK83_10595 [Planctomycetes bacterium]|nr:hypothetical protein [Planctomycetota bacterium]